MQQLISGLWDCPLDWHCHSKLVVVQLNSILKSCQSLLANDFGVSDAIDEIPGQGCKVNFGPTYLHENPENACPGLWIWSIP